MSAPQPPVPGPTPPSFTPLRAPLEGTVHAPRSRAVAAPRRRGRWLTVGVPAVLAGALGISSFLVLGVSALVGGASLLGPLLAGLGIAAVTGGGAHLLLRGKRPRPVKIGHPAAEIPTGTRTALEKIVRDSRRQQRRVQAMQRRARGTTVVEILRRAESLLLRVDALLDTATVQSRRASDPDVMLLDGMAERYVPELVDALEGTVGFLGPTTTPEARERAIANLHAIDAQLDVLARRLDRLENEIVTGVTRTLDVHSEFLRTRFAEPGADPFLDR